MPIDKTNYLYASTDKLISMYDDLTRYALDDIVTRVLQNGVITGTSEYQIWKLQEMGYHLDKIRIYIKQMTKYSDQEIDKIFKGSGIDYYKSVNKISIDYGMDTPLALNTSQFMDDVFSYYVR